MPESKAKQQNILSFTFLGLPNSLSFSSSQSLCFFSSGRAMGPSSCSTCGQADPHFLFHSPPPLSERSFWTGARPATTFSAEAASATTSLTQLPPLGSNLATFRYTDGWISLVSWYAMQRCFSSVMDVQLV